MFYGSTWPKMPSLKPAAESFPECTGSLGDLAALRQNLCPTLVLLQLPGLTVQPREEEPGRLPDVATVHRRAAAMLGVHHAHPDPRHQRREEQERPGGGGGGGYCCFLILV